MGNYDQLSLSGYDNDPVAFTTPPDVAAKLDEPVGELFKQPENAVDLGNMAINQVDEV